MAETAYIVDGVRSPFCRRNGSLAGIRPDDLAAAVLNRLVERNRLDPAAVEDVRLGISTQTGEQGLNLGRLVPLVAGWPETVPGATVNRMCGSSLETLNQCAEAIMAGSHDVMVAAGVESMSRVPMLSDGAGFSDRLLQRYQIVPQGMSAEIIADRWHLSREELDAFSLESHRRAVAAQDAGWFDEEIVPIPVPGEAGPQSVHLDEGPRRDTSLEKLASLKPAFKPDGRITAGNSSQITDGASALLVASEAGVVRHGLRPRARVVALARVGVDPVIMLTGPIPATERVLARAGLSFEQMDVVEINEAFASVVLAWGREYHPDWERVNPHGGAIALGHPLGASGGRLVLTALRELERIGGRYALITMCIGWGIGLATIIERVA
jgi:acetyl-CoA acyltransferase